MTAAVDLLNSVAEHVVHADAPAPGEVIPLRGGPVIEIVRVAEPTAHLAVAAALNGPELHGTAAGVRRRPRALAVGRRASAAGAAGSPSSGHGPRSARAQPEGAGDMAR